MKSSALAALRIVLGLLPAVLAAFTVRGIYQEGNLLSSGLALAIPLLLLLGIHGSAEKRLLSAFAGLVAGSSLALLWMAGAGELTSFALLTIVLVTLLTPIALDLVLLDIGTRALVSMATARSAGIVFAATFIPLTALLVQREHQGIVQREEALLREVAQHVQVWENYLIFEHVDPRHKTELRNSVAVRAKGKTYELSNAHFESVSEERTVQKKTERRGTQKTLAVSREREEQMRVVVDMQDKTPPSNIVVFSTRGPVTIAEQEVTLPGEETVQDPVS
jgi:hypothetical protein